MPVLPGGPVAARESTGPRSPGAPRAYSRARRRLDRMRERDAAELVREAPEAPADASRGVEEASIVRETPALRAELWSGDEHEEPALSSLLALLNRVARARTEHSDGRVETWAKIRITPEMVLSVRGIDEEDGDLVERVRREIRRAIDRR
ncbi:MAG: hypothetical protein F4Y07_16640 [Gemmatimonadetes bacterium]|nr:hypothetical protein [Gemmatimonadota bacterium]